MGGTIGYLGFSFWGLRRYRFSRLVCVCVVVLLRGLRGVGCWLRVVLPILGGRVGFFVLRCCRGLLVNFVLATQVVVFVCLVVFGF